MSYAQNIILIILLYMFIGLVVSIQFILRHQRGLPSTEYIAEVVNRMVLFWPVHLCIMTAIYIIAFVRRGDGD